jgi:hypothetical protein
MRPIVLLALTLALILPAGALVADAGPSAKDLALLKSLKKQRLTKVAFKETDLKGVVKWLRVATSKNILVKQHELAKAGIDWQDLRFTVELENVSVWTFLDDVLTRPYGMAVKVKGNIVFVTSKADSYGKPVTKLYGISHITWTKTDFIAPPLDLHPSGFVEEEYEPEKIVEDDPLNNGDAVAELVQDLVAPKAWDENDDWHIKATDRYLVIRAPREVHAKIPRALAIVASMK